MLNSQSQIRISLITGKKTKTTNTQHTSQKEKDWQYQMLARMQGNTQLAGGYIGTATVETPCRHQLPTS